MELTSEQQRFIDLVMQGENVFLTGYPGTGKSALLNLLTERLAGKRRVFVTSTTGMSAYSIQGATIHSFLSCGIGQPDDYSNMLSRIDDMVAKKHIYRELHARITSADTLAIDEVSMLNPILFYWLDILARKIRGEKDKYFGGIQLVLIGDFMQCEVIQRPIRNAQRQLTQPNTTPHPAFTERFLFNTPLWKEAIQHTVVLTQPFRQDNSEYFQLLSRLRYNQLTDEDVSVLKGRVMENTRNAPSCFFTNNKVAEVNKYHYEQLAGTEYTLTASYGLLQKSVGNRGVYLGKPKLIIDRNTMQDAINKLEASVPISKDIKLKFGTRVLVRKNIDVAGGLINGTVGIVVDMQYAESEFNGIRKLFPVIEYEHKNTKKRVLLKDRPSFMIQIKSDNIFMAMYQVPISYGWSITIHKLQSATMSSLHGSTEGIRYKCGGLIYVMLSRVKSLEDITFSEFNENTVYVAPELIEFEKKMFKNV